MSAIVLIAISVLRISLGATVGLQITTTKMYFLSICNSFTEYRYWAHISFIMAVIPGTKSLPHISELNRGHHTKRYCMLHSGYIWIPSLSIIVTVLQLKLFFEPSSNQVRDRNGFILFYRVNARKIFQLFFPCDRNTQVDLRMLNQTFLTCHFNFPYYKIYIVYALYLKYDIYLMRNI